ncbi:MAG: Gfo/Idh/MocA family oxidoreductase [Opitutaceae bacterium]|nr:Gfo/Idh/MocA family oxidoreductase [Opitutaceae bacterium]
MSNPIRVGVIGAGNNTRGKHLPGFKAIPGVEIVAVCNRTAESGGRVAREFGIPLVAGSWQEIIDSPQIDAVCIGTWPNLHSKLTVAALRAGKHVLTEARMARNLAEAEQMLEESRRHPKLVAQIVPAPGSLAFDATIADLVQSGALGTLREVLMTSTTGALVDSARPRSWREDFVLSGKNTLFLGLYYEMALRWLGREVTALVADAAIFTRERKDEDGVPQPMTIPESVTVLGTYADGARLAAHCSAVESTPLRNEILLNGSKAGLRLDLVKGELWLAPAGGPEQPVAIVPEKRGAWRVEADFIDSIRDGQPVRLTDFASGVKYMRFTEAVWESWNAGGQRVTLSALGSPPA